MKNKTKLLNKKLVFYRVRVTLCFSLETVQTNMVLWSLFPAVPDDRGNFCKNPTFAIIWKPSFTVNVFPTVCFMKPSPCSSFIAVFRLQGIFRGESVWLWDAIWDLFNLSGKLSRRLIGSAKPLCVSQVNFAVSLVLFSTRHLSDRLHCFKSTHNSILEHTGLWSSVFMMFL